jgi:hypothetical protein
MSFREEWFVNYVDYATDGITTEYTIPSQAVGSKLRDVQIWENGKQYLNVPRLAPEQLSDSFFGFYVQNNKIIIYPNSLQTGKTPNTFVTGALIDIISKSSPFSVKETLEISTVVGSTINFTTATTAIAGDYACVSGESVFPEIPSECIPMLCQSAGIRCLEALGDTEGLQIAMANYIQIENSAKATLSPKVDGEVKRVQNKRRLMRYIL